MTQVTANGIGIEYDTFGEAGSPALLMIMGLATQMIGWDADLCQQLADTGLFVIRFDNRDVGLSTKFEPGGIPNVMEAMTAALEGKSILSPYSLDDMADDAVGLLSALQIEKAHICGASMGGMIAQTVAYRHPGRILSLISIMSSTGDTMLPPPRPDAMAALSAPAPPQRQAFIESNVQVWKVIGSPGFPFDEAKIRKQAGEAFDRSYYPQGYARQLVAIMAQGNRSSNLKSVSVPTLVIHGSDDPLVPVEGGRATANAIPGAELLIINGMGHDFPEGAWPQLVEAISTHVKKAVGQASTI